ncbi:MAG TPA: APC family permease [Actinomycetota bacterium]|nr:APC family permease [Actinomycetota bacterium]
MSELRKTISPAALTALGAAGVIGSSWLYLGGDFFKSFGAGGTILGFLLATLLAASVALAYAELASAMPRAGGEIVYGYVAAGRYPSFIVGWLLIGAYVGMVGFYVTATGRLLSAVWPQLESLPLYELGGGTIYLPVLAIGVGLTLVMLAINWYGAGLSSKTQLVLFVCMALLALVVAGTGFVAGSADNLFPMFDTAVTGDASPVVLSLMFMLPAFSFLTGFGVVAVMAEEARATPAQIGRIVVISVLLAGAFYTIVLAATGWLLPWQEVAGMSNGTIEAFEVAGYHAISMAAFAIGVLGLLTTFLAVFGAASRLMLALARIQMLPERFGSVDEQTKTPRFALAFTAVVGVLLGMLGPSAILWFLNTGGIYIGVVWGFTVFAMYRIRRKYPHMIRSRGWVRTWIPALGVLAALGVVAVALIPGTPLALRWPYEYMIVGGWVLLGTVLFVLSPRRMTREEGLDALLGEHRAQLER